MTLVQPDRSAAAPITRGALATEWLLGRINYERSQVVPYGERQLKLDRMRQFVTALGSPDAAAPIIHIAGTKGKGSTAAMVAAMLTAAGYRTGVFSSPHLERLEERFAIDGIPATGEQLADLVDVVRPVVEQFDRRAAESDEDGLTFFDITTAIALVHFAQQQCAAVVLEVGLGGRLDSTNVCLPAVSVITSISFDHTKQLGNTLASIAGEKAGIVKSGVPVVSGVPADSEEGGNEPRTVIAQVALEHGCRLIEAGRDFRYRHHPSKGGDSFDYLVGNDARLSGIDLALAGEHQAANAAVAMATIDELVNQGWQIAESARREGLAAVRLAGRIELVPGSPVLVLDTAHNAASAMALAATLRTRCEQPRTLVVSCSHDKDFEAIATAMAGVFQRIIVTEYQSNPRVVSGEELATMFRQSTSSAADVCIEVEADPTRAWHRAIEVTPPTGLVCIAGSFFLAAELRPLVLGERQQASG